MKTLTTLLLSIVLFIGCSKKSEATYPDPPVGVWNVDNGSGSKAVWNINDQGVYNINGGTSYNYTHTATTIDFGNHSTQPGWQGTSQTDYTVVNRDEWYTSTTTPDKYGMPVLHKLLHYVRSK